MYLRHPTFLATLAFLAVVACTSLAEQDDGFVPMFNGRDLTGWVNVNCAPETFFVKDGMIITTGKPTGYMRTEKQYENFIAEFEWMHLPPTPTAMGNSGFFVWADAIPAVGTGYTRGHEVQVLVNHELKDAYTSQGDLFSIWGATCVPDRPHPKGAMRCLPSENRCKGAFEWNHYRVVANDGAIKLSVNGKEVSGISQCNPRKGYLALESEGSECRFKNLKIKELPSTNTKPDQTTDIAVGFQSLFTGLDLRGWQAGDDQKAHWKPQDKGLGFIAYDGKPHSGDPNLWTAKEYGNFELVLDWRLPGKKKSAQLPVILPTGEAALDGDKIMTQTVDDAGNGGILLRGSTKGQISISCWPIGSGEVRAYREDKSQPPEIRTAATPKVKADQTPGKWNRFRIRMKDDRVTVFLNDKLVIDNARLLGIAARGRIGLQHQGDPVDFGNLFVRELGKGD